MANVKIRRIDIGSLAVFEAKIGLIVGVIYGLIILATGFAGSSVLGGSSLLVGIGGFVAAVVISPISGLVSGALSALLYNVLFYRIGMIEVELQ
jgi:Mg/Co/Ni transporter MgtE